MRKKMKEKQAACDQWFQHEGLDRSSMLINHLHFAFGEDGEYHPSIWNDRCKEDLEKAMDALTSLYQAIGEWDKDD